VKTVLRHHFRLVQSTYPDTKSGIHANKIRVKFNLYSLEYLQGPSTKAGKFRNTYNHPPLRSSRECFDYQHRDVVVRRRLSLLVEVLRQKSAEVYRAPRLGCYHFFRLGRRAVAEHLGLDDSMVNQVDERKKSARAANHEVH